MDMFTRDAELVIHHNTINQRHIKTELIRAKPVVLIATYFKILLWMDIPRIYPYSA